MSRSTSTERSNLVGTGSQKENMRGACIDESNIIRSAVDLHTAGMDPAVREAFRLKGNKTPSTMASPHHLTANNNPIGTMGDHASSPISNNGISNESTGAVLRRNPKDNSTVRSRSRNTTSNNTFAPSLSPPVQTNNKAVLPSSGQRRTFSHSTQQQTAGGSTISSTAHAMHVSSAQHERNFSPMISAFHAFHDFDGRLIHNQHPRSKSSHESETSVKFELPQKNSTSKLRVSSTDGEVTQPVFKPMPWDDEFPSERFGAKSVSIIDQKIFDEIDHLKDNPFHDAQQTFSDHQQLQQQLEHSTFSQAVVRNDSFVSDTHNNDTNASFGDEWQDVDAHDESPQALHQHPLIFLPDGLDTQEQAMFEQRLCYDSYGIAVRKINATGKAQLRYVQCITMSVPLSKRNADAKTKARKQNMSKSLPTDLNNSFPSAAGSNVAHPGSVRKKQQHRRTSSSGRSVNSLIGRMAQRRTIRSPSASTGNNDSASLSVTNRSRTDSVSSTNTSNMESSMNTANNNIISIMNSPHSRLDASLDENFEEGDHNDTIRFLTWGNKKKVKIPLSRFIAVRKGKTTERTKKNVCPESRLLSLITDDVHNQSLDIEAPTKLDRDKFALAFSKFLQVPLIEEGDQATENLMNPGIASLCRSSPDLALSIPVSLDHNASGVDNEETPKEKMGSIGDGVTFTRKSPLDSKLVAISPTEVGGAFERFSGTPPNKADNKGDSIRRINDSGKSFAVPSENTIDHGEERGKSGGVILDWSGTKALDTKKEEDAIGGSDVSSLTQGFDQEIIEELHQTITELRSELEASRAEAARAVKVAEQAIQSAESCSSNDWNSTVTHKAAEAAAQAQKRSAEAMARQRIAEENLAAERKNADFWRKHSESVEREINALQIRVAAAEVQRSMTRAELERIKKFSEVFIENLKSDFSCSQEKITEKLTMAEEQNRILEVDLHRARHDIKVSDEERKKLNDALTEMNARDGVKASSKKNFFGRNSSKKTRDNSTDTSVNMPSHDHANLEPCHSLDLSNILNEVKALRNQLLILRQTTFDEMQQLPQFAIDWANQAKRALIVPEADVSALKEKLALEASFRRKLLHELQDLRGCVRVYCRPKLPSSSKRGFSLPSIISIPTQDVCVLHRELVIGDGVDMSKDNPLRFEFDKVFPLSCSQNEVYAELEETILDSLDGFNVCLLSYGPTGSGKTFTMIGDVSITTDAPSDPEVTLQCPGVALIAAQQLFDIAKHRSDKFLDVFFMSLIEVYNEKLIDMVGVSTNAMDKSIEASSKSAPQKLEIKTNQDGYTVVQGLTRVQLSSYDEFVQVWTEAISSRTKRLQEDGIDRQTYESCCHTIATLEIISTNISNGSGTVGKIQFVDLAASDSVIRRKSSGSSIKSAKTPDILAPVGNTHEWKFMNKSISALADVAIARSQFSRTVPYRNSTLTHLLRDSLEADTKVVLLLCVGCDGPDLQDTANAMRFASVMRNVVVGKATKHLVA